MSWLSHCLAAHPHVGGLEYTALVTGLNVALVGWENFTKKIKDTESLLQALVEAGCASLQDTDVSFLKWGCRQIVSKKLVDWRTQLWTFNYTLALAALFTGLGMLYFGIESRLAIFLVLPLVFQFILSWGPAVISLGMIRIMIWCSPKVAGAIRQMKHEEANIGAKTKEAKEHLLPSVPRPSSTVRERIVYEDRPLK